MARVILAGVEYEAEVVQTPNGGTFYRFKANDGRERMIHEENRGLTIVKASERVDPDLAKATQWEAEAASCLDHKPEAWEAMAKTCYIIADSFRAAHALRVAFNQRAAVAA